jgi:DNA polymerase IV
VPIEAENACCIAASYQAEAYGIKTGFNLPDAKIARPHLLVVHARPRLRVEYHHKIIEAIEQCVRMPSSAR